MSTLLPFIAITLAALALVLWSELKRRPTFNLVFKPVASLGFVAASVAAGAFDSTIGLMLFVSLVFSMAGDVFLIFKESRGAFLLGIGAFALSHVGYTIVFAMMGVAPLTLGLALAGFAVVGYLIHRWLAPFTQGPMKVAVPGYIAIITAMVAFAVGTSAYLSELLPLLAATSFWLSDITVARHRFVKATPANRLVGLPLYYLAQYLFVGLLL